MNLRPQEILLILLVLVLLFGAKRLPDTARAMGQSLKIFKKSVRDDEEQPTPGPDQHQITATSDTTQPSRVTKVGHAET
jgi:sec-independent protein translocase protein TatA